MSPQPSRDREGPFPAPGQAWYLVGVLMVISILAFVDRLIFSLLVAPIRRDLGISDTQVSLLIGASFAVSFAIWVIPLGRLADRRSRRMLIALGLAVWSVCTAACGLASSFVQILLFRMGVGAGEAALNPSAYSMIADSFPEGRRTTAMGVYSMGITLGSGLALMTGGLIVRLAAGQETWSLPVAGIVRSWQLILLELGVTGLALSGLLWTTREPARRGRKTSDQVPLADVVAWISQNRATLLCHNAGFALLTSASFAGVAWIPEMFRRNFGWSIPQFALAFGLETAVCGSLGVIFAGRIADHWFRRGLADASLRVAVIAGILGLVTAALAFLSPSGGWALAWFAPGAACMSAAGVLAPASIQQIVPAGMRGQITALALLAINVTGAAGGPTITALFTQHVFRSESAVHYSLLLVHALVLPCGAALLWIGRRPYVATFERLRTSLTAP